MICIYRINCPNGRFYIGSTKNYDKRIKRHMRDLLMQRHHNSILQRIYNKHDVESLQFVIVEECNIADLFDKETAHILGNENNPKNINLLMSSTWGDTLSNHPRKKEIIAQRSASFRKLMNSLSPKEKIEAYGRPGIMNGSFGKHHTEHTKKICGIKGKVGAKTRTIQMSGKTYEEIYGKNKTKKIKGKLSKSISLSQRGSANNFFGKHHTEKSKQLQSQIRKGIYGGSGSQNMPLIINGIEYLSAGEAASKLGISAATIRFRTRSKNKQFTNYQYKI